MTKNFLTLVSALKKMPGVTNKQATNIAYYLILNPSTLTHELINKISEAKKNIKTCQQCNCLIDEKTYCDICTNPNRDQHTLCIVANHDDLNKIENTKSFTGLYYIVHQLKNQEKQIDLIKLLQLITTKNISDVIIAFDWTNSGELSALNIRNSLLSRFPKLTIYRLAVGLPVNSAINYADETTLKYAIKNKFKY